MILRNPFTTEAPAGRAWASFLKDSPNMAKHVLLGRPIYTHPDFRVFEDPQDALKPLIVHDMITDAWHEPSPFYDVNDPVEIIDWLLEKRKEQAA